jgi:hypothetical protein
VGCLDQGLLCTASYTRCRGTSLWGAYGLGCDVVQRLSCCCCMQDCAPACAKYAVLVMVYMLSPALSLQGAC